MYRPNQGHLQKPLLSGMSGMNTLPETQRKRLEESWAQTFYEEVFCRIDESIFEVLYSDKVSRPNVPVNVQVRYALGYQNLEDGQFAIKTVYNFRRRSVTHQEETEENLFGECFEQITGEQMLAYEVNGRTRSR